MSEIIERPASVRSQVMNFARHMEAKLRTKDEEHGEDGWIGDRTTVRFLHDRLTEELTEARHAMNDCYPDQLAAECVDIANFAMMIFDRIDNR